MFIDVIVVAPAALALAVIASSLLLLTRRIDRDRDAAAPENEYAATDEYAVDAPRQHRDGSRRPADPVAH